jgi:hypothetical protein
VDIGYTNSNLRKQYNKFEFSIRGLNQFEIDEIVQIIKISLFRTDVTSHHGAGKWRYAVET